MICLSNEKWDDFHIGYGGKVTKLKLTDTVNYLKEVEMRKYIHSTSSKFMEFMAKENNSDMMTEDVVQVYHVFWAESVISVNKTVQSEQVIMKGKAVNKTRNFPNARMWQEFLDGTINDSLLGGLRNDIFCKYGERYLVSKKGNDPSFDSNDHRANALEELVSFLAKLDHTNIRRDDITSEAVFKVICNLTGSLLKYDKTDGKMKFSTYQDLGISGKKCMDLLKAAYNNHDLQSFRFDIVGDIAKRKLQNEIFKVPAGFGNVSGTFRSSYSV